MSDPRADLIAIACQSDIRTEDIHAVAVCLNEVGTANYTMGDLDSAIEFYTRSSSIFETIGHQRGMAQSFGGLAVAQCAKGRLDQVNHPSVIVTSLTLTRGSYTDASV